MPKKKYNDQELKKKALELRNQGLSYRKIAKELNCSVFKVHQILSSKTNTIAARNEKEKYYTYESIDTTEENSEFILPTLSEVLDQLLEAYDITGNLKERIIKIFEINPYMKTNYEDFFYLLISNRIDPNYARIIADTIFARIHYEQQYTPPGPLLKYSFYWPASLN